MLDRRTFLILGATACTARTDPPAPTVDPDEALLADARTAETALLGAYDGALAAFPEMAPVWGPLRADHATHLERLALDGTVAFDSATPAPTPGNKEQVRRMLLALTRDAARTHAAGVVPASPDLAGVLASLAACESSHTVLL